MNEREFEGLITYLEKVPSIISSIGKGIDENGFWWIKFQIDIENDYSWNVIQELGSVINY